MSKDSPDPHAGEVCLRICADVGVPANGVYLRLIRKTMTEVRDLAADMLSDLWHQEEYDNGPDARPAVMSALQEAEDVLRGWWEER